MSKRSAVTLRHRCEREQRFACDDRKPRKNRQHSRTRKRASRSSPRRQLLHLLLYPRRPEHADPVGRVQRDAEDEREVERGAARGPAVQRSLDILIVELGGAEG